MLFWFVWTISDRLAEVFAKYFCWRCHYDKEHTWISNSWNFIFFLVMSTKSTCSLSCTPLLSIGVYGALVLHFAVNISMFIFRKNLAYKPLWRTYIILEHMVQPTLSNAIAPRILNINQFGTADGFITFLPSTWMFSPCNA